MHGDDPLRMQQQGAAVRFATVAILLVVGLAATHCWRCESPASQLAEEVLAALRRPANVA